MNKAHARSALALLAATVALHSACDDSDTSPAEPTASQDDQDQDDQDDQDAASGAALTRADFERAERDANLPEPTKLDNGDGTWSYALDANFDPATEVQGKLLTWAYAGQADFSNEPQQGGERTFVVREEVPQTAEDKLLDTVRVDIRGRRWTVVDVDHDAWAAVRAPAPEENEGDEPPDTLPLRAAVDEPAVGTEITWKPMGWTHSSCIPGGGINPNEAHFWDGDSRHEKPNPIGRQKTAVTVRVNGSAVCSGVILRSREVLTAAHCVSDDSNNHLPVGTVSVARNDIFETRTATDIDFPNSYTGGSGSGGGTDFADDWAIIELDSSWSAGYEDMDMSSAGDGTLDALDKVHNLGFTSFFPLCQDTGLKLLHNVEAEPIAAVLNKKLRFKIDGTPGHSGGPLYYCPEGDNNICGGGEKGFVIAVFAGWNTANNRFVGPKSEFFFDTAQAFMDD